jgi:hypothetical protein
MKAYAIWLHIYSFLSDRGIHASVTLGVLAVLNWDLVIKIIFGLPSFIYVCLKIYREFIRNAELDPVLKRKLTEKAEETQNGKIDIDYSKE